LRAARLGGSLRLMTRFALAAVLALSLAAPALAQRAAPPAPIDINSASVEALEALPGVGPARARAIVAGRPWRDKGELTRRGVLPASVYRRVRPLVIANRPRSF
jgi:DNA uptake protein ComE-like DNA-binding protein